MAMLNECQFDTESFWDTIKLHYRRGRGRFIPYFLNRLYFNHLCRYHIRKKMPPHVDIEPTMLCNMQCPMCFLQHIPVKKEGFLDFELYKKIVDECAQKNVYSVRLCHRGEPLLHKKIVDMIKYAKEKGIKEVFTLTNGFLLTEKMILDLYDADIDWIQVSIDGTHNVYNKIRKPARFEDVYEKVKLMHKIRSDQKRLRPVIWVQSLWSAVKDNPEQYVNLFRPYVDKIAFHIDVDYESRFKKSPDFVCHRLWHRMMVMADGTVPMCNSDFLKDEIMGNVNNQTVEEIWNSEQFERVRKLNLEKKRLELAPCSKCNWGNSKEEKEVLVKGKRVKVMANIPEDAYIEELEDIQIK